MIQLAIRSTMATLAALTVLSTAAMARVPVNGGMPGNDLDAGKCIGNAQDVLAQKGVIDPALVHIQVRQNGSETTQPQGFDYYFTTPSCGGNGYVIVTTTDYCYTQQVYTRYNCRIPGVMHSNF